jgi:site-specific DNA recombinase
MITANAPLRAVIYARYSSDLQREASLADQEEICRRYCAQMGWTVVHVYSDAALSAASALLRPGFQQMKADAFARVRKFDVVVCEAFNRLGRRLADTADLHDRLSHAGIKMHAPKLGEIMPMHVAIFGMMAQMQLADTAAQTWRSQLGRIKEGKVAGGIAYGYDVLPGIKKGKSLERGGRSINAQEAAVVVDIFRRFANGTSPEAIAQDLNARGVPGPGGREWQNTTIRGQPDRGTGILNNASYVGRLEWNRCAYVKDPATGKKVPRPNPRDKWEVVEVPTLRIMEDELWDKVRARQQEIAARVATRKQQAGDDLGINEGHRRKFLLSNLLTCGVCGGGYTITGKDRYGCATRKIKGTCGNERTITRQEIEARTLSGLKERLMAPDVVASFVNEFTRKINETGKAAGAALEEQRRELIKVTKGIDGIVTAIEGGMFAPEMKARMEALQVRKAALKAQLESAPSANIVRLLPNLSEIYAQKVEKLSEALNDDLIKPDAIELIRSLISQVVLTPRTESKGLDAVLYGDLAQILVFCEAAGTNTKIPTAKAIGSQLSVVAGAGFEPATFRL